MISQTDKFNTLFSKASMGNLQIKNRIGLAPMTRISASDTGEATDLMVKYYAKFARGGFGFLITEGTFPDEEYSQAYLNEPGIANQNHVEAWKKVTKAVHKEGIPIFLQLMHAGSQSQGNIFRDETIAPSSVRPKGEQLPIYRGDGPFAVPREMTKDEIHRVICSFADSALRAKEAGFDGVEIHGANGYLLDQFLTDYMNQRPDEYGGSTENRVRLLMEICEAVRKKVGENYIVGIRISQGKVSDHNHKWAGKEKDAEIIFSGLAKTGIDYIHVTEYDATKPAFEGTEHTLAALAKKFGKITVIANGNLEDPKKAEELLQKGEADFITLGKGALANQDYPNRVLNGEQIRDFEFSLLQPLANIKDMET
ncbi:NADH:flavin oxidoreductase [Brevibacillus sp. H7]|uniref:NADH:flavin oxidoreductase n=1 Tax=Brevibacillus sp. H7 TaxID=3349138 RepID=UPI00381ECF65